MTYHRDDGTIVNPKDYPIPKLCLQCKLLGNPHEEISCTLNRIDVEEGEEFQCYAFLDIGWKMTRLKYLFRKIQYRVRYLFIPKWLKG
jgi:hypothetical protein